MKIGIDARLYGPSHGGIGRYIEQLIKHLEQIDNKNQYVVFLNLNNYGEYHPQNNNFKKVKVDYKVYSLKEQLLFSLKLKKYKFDLVHFPHFNVPIFFRKRFIVTIHDLIISHYPDSRATTLNPVLYKLKLFFYYSIVKSTAKRSQKIIAVSKFTKNDIVTRLGVNPDKVKVIYEGVPKKTEVKAIEPSIRNYILYVGSAYPHKNLEKLLMAFKNTVKEKPKLKLVLVGKKDFFYQRLEKEIARLDLKNKVLITGYISDNQLAGYYQKARLYVFPSLIEGFGLPPLEAQVYGLPVVSSNLSCLPEVLGDSAVYFNPKDQNEMKEKILLVLNDHNLKQELIAKGEENIKNYSWDRCAVQTLAEYK